MTVCACCGRPVDSNPRTAYQRAEAWREPNPGRRASGHSHGSDYVLPELRDVWAHPSCIALLRAGLNVEQEILPL